MITAYIGVFEEKLKRLKSDLKKELERAKSDRRKDVMKRLVQDAKGLQKTIKEANKFSNNRNVCWVCGGELIWGGDHDLDKEDNPEYYIVSNLTCSSCESFVEVYHKRPKDESK